MEKEVNISLECAPANRVGLCIFCNHSAGMERISTLNTCLSFCSKLSVRITLVNYMTEIKPAGLLNSKAQMLNV